MLLIAVPVEVISLWAFWRADKIVEKDLLAQLQVVAGREEQLFTELVADPTKRIISRTEAATLVLVASGVAGWPLVLIGWKLGRSIGAAIGTFLVVPGTVYGYVQIRPLPKRVERARRLRAR